MCLYNINYISQLNNSNISAGNLFSQAIMLGSHKRFSGNILKLFIAIITDMVIHVFIYQYENIAFFCSISMVDGDIFSLYRVGSW